MSDDVETDDIPCPACGHHETLSQSCPDCGGEGVFDAYDEDPINEDPGSYYPCDGCSGNGIARWCPKCGRDYWNAKREKARQA